MKAKEMAEIFEAHPNADTVRGLLVKSLDELKDLMLSRGVKSNSGLLAVLKQQDDKWRAFCRRCPEVQPEAFKTAALRIHPSIALLWK